MIMCASSSRGFLGYIEIITYGVNNLLGIKSLSIDECFLR